MFKGYQKLLPDHLKSAIKSCFIYTSIGKTHYLDTGNLELPVMVVIHGTNSCAAQSMNYVEGLMQRFRVIALDIPGEPGKSEFYRLSKKNEELSNWLEACIHQLELKQVTILGYSLGAYITIKTTIQSSKLFKQVIIIAPAGVIHGSFYNGIIKGLLPVLGYKMLKRESILIRLYKNLVTTFKPLQYDYFKWITLHFKSDWSQTPLFTKKELQSISIPITALIASHDIIFNPKKIKQRLEASIPQIEIHILEQEKHVMNPERVSRLLQELI